jgi:hypothetical protein
VVEDELYVRAGNRVASGAVSGDAQVEREPLSRLILRHFLRTMDEDRKPGSMHIVPHADGPIAPAMRCAFSATGVVTHYPRHGTLPETQCAAPCPDRLDELRFHRLSGRQAVGLDNTTASIVTR